MILNVLFLSIIISFLTITGLFISLTEVISVSNNKTAPVVNYNELFLNVEIITCTNSTIGALNSQAGISRGTPNTKRCGRSLDWAPVAPFDVLIGICRMTRLN